MSRDRLEDLGRLTVLIENILEKEIFTEERMLAQDFPKWFWHQGLEKQHQIISRIAHCIPDVEESLVNALQIAKGVDSLNGTN